MLEISWVGGSDDDRKAVAEQHHAYLVANASFDWEMLKGVFSEADWATYFNLNGHVYAPRSHWIKLWQYYINNMKTGYWEPFDMKGVMSGDLATVWCLRKTRSTWIGADRPMVTNRDNGAEFISRSTMVFCKEPVGWRSVHIHFSQSSIGEPRPGDV